MLLTPRDARSLRQVIQHSAQGLRIHPCRVLLGVPAHVTCTLPAVFVRSDLCQVFLELESAGNPPTSSLDELVNFTRRCGSDTDVQRPVPPIIVDAIEAAVFSDPF